MGHQDVSSSASGVGNGHILDSKPKAGSNGPEIPQKTSYLETYQKLVGIQSFVQPVEGVEHPPEGAERQTVSAPINAKRDRNNGRPPRSFFALLYKPYTYNDGYYQRAVDEQLKASIGFQLFNVTFTGIYILQICVAAVITALSAYTGHRITLTILGAINTVLAGLMAYFKGMGLPNRLRKSRDQFDHVRIYAEYKERQFAEYDHFGTVISDPSLSSLDPWIEAETVRKLYEAAKKDQQDNYPDLYLNNNTRDQLQQMMGSYETRNGAHSSVRHQTPGVQEVASVQVGGTIRTISRVNQQGSSQSGHQH